MLGDNQYICGPCPKCGANDFWNNSKCMNCGYEQEDEDEDDE